MTHCRQVMLEELQRRNYAKNTIYYYLKAVERFAKNSISATYASIRRICSASGSSGRERSSSTSPHSGSSSSRHSSAPTCWRTSHFRRCRDDSQ